MVRVSAYRAPALPGDAQDHDGHPQADDWIEEGCACCDGDGADDDGERDVCVDAGVIAVCDQRSRREQGGRGVLRVPAVHYWPEVAIVTSVVLEVMALNCGGTDVALT